MKIASRFLLAMVALLGLGGCRALSTGSLAPTPGPLADALSTWTRSLPPTIGTPTGFKVSRQGRRSMLPER